MERLTKASSSSLDGAACVAAPLSGLVAETAGRMAPALCLWFRVTERSPGLQLGGVPSGAWTISSPHGELVPQLRLRSRRVDRRGWVGCNP